MINDLQGRDVQTPVFDDRGMSRWERLTISDVTSWLSNEIEYTTINLGLRQIDIDKITDYGVMATPALAVDGKVISAGRIPNKDEIKKMISK